MSFAYDEQAVLHDVSFVAAEGQVTALVGPSGAGKTTIARLIPRFWDASAGAVLVGGVDVHEMAVDQLMEHVAFVFQDTFCFHDTVEGNVRVGRPEATEEEVVAATRAARARNFVQSLPMGYQTMVGERGARLSGGERQRLAIAAGLLKDAPVVVLDQATAFTDPDNEAAIQEAVSALTAGRTLIVVAHRPATVTGADQILVVDGGRIVERGRHDELLALGGVYQRMWVDSVTARDASLGQAVHCGEDARR